MIPMVSPRAAIPANRRKDGAQARLQGTARKAPQVQSGESAEEHDLKGEPKGAGKRQRAKLEKRKSNVYLYSVSDIAMWTIFKYTLPISIAFLNNILVPGGSNFSLSQQTLDNTKHMLVLD